MQDHTDRQGNTHHVLRIDDGSDLAGKLFEHHKAHGSFPPIWSRIDNDRSKLDRIFAFFFAMRDLLLHAPTHTMELLRERLEARVYGDAPPLPSGHEVIIEHLSERQHTAFTAYRDLLAHAFDIFAAGELALHRPEPCPLQGDGSVTGCMEPPAATTFAEAVELPEPDGAAFFYWAEFAFVAAGCGVHKDPWKKILPVLLRAERIFTLTYGRPVEGRVPPETTFMSYKPCTYRRLDPSAIEGISFDNLETYEQLDGAATECARLAFPGWVRPSDPARCRNDAPRPPSRQCR